MCDSLDANGLSEFFEESHWEKRKNEPKLYMEMERLEGTLVNLRLRTLWGIDLHTRLQFAFELVYVVQQAREHLQLAHNDLDVCNVGFAFSNAPRHYVLDDGSKLLCDSPLVPRLIDFRRSRVNVEAMTESNDTTVIIKRIHELGVNTPVMLASMPTGGGKPDYDVYEDMNYDTALRFIAAEIARTRSSGPPDKRRKIGARASVVSE